MIISNIVDHIIDILMKKTYVLIYCFRIGLYWRGIKHDISRFSLIEFIYSIENYDPVEYPLDMRRRNSISQAYIHYISKNDYTIEHWICNDEPCKMPFASASECIVHLIASERILAHFSFSYINVFKRYVTMIDNGLKIHPHTKKFIYYILADLANDEDYKWSIKNILTNKYFKKIYRKSECVNEKSFERDRCRYEKIFERD